MKRVLALSGVLLLSIAPGLAQQSQPIKLYTNAIVPSREVLNKLSLTLAWRTKLSTEGVRDGFTSVQLAPGVAGGQDMLLVQTFSGSVYAFNAETGDLLWRTPVGL